MAQSMESSGMVRRTSSESPRRNCGFVDSEERYAFTLSLSLSQRSRLILLVSVISDSHVYRQSLFAYYGLQKDGDGSGQAQAEFAKHLVGFVLEFGVDSHGGGRHAHRVVLQSDW